MRALEASGPDIVLIEGPPDAAGLIADAAHPEMQPPVAILIFNPKDLNQASFFPFAEFSPEWQAIQFAVRNSIPVRFMDLPMSLAFGLQDESPQLSLELNPSDPNEALRDDPFRRIALLAGYSDPERWWDALVERYSAQHSTEEASGTIFSAILELMDALRADKTRPESRETLLREAHMRQCIRGAQKEGFKKIAVVCGAWHGPALDPSVAKAGADATLLKGLKKIKTETTWIPWSFDRLATQSGYGAGLVAPAWYRVLWESGERGVGSRDWGIGIGSAPTPQSPIPNPYSPISHWLTLTARLLREKDIAVSSAHVIEAVRLAETLAVLRRTALPGIGELREAAVTVMCGGAEAQLDLIDRQLVIGDVLGRVPSGLPQPPLKADFEKQVKSCRLDKNTQEKTLELDLREEAQLRKSRLLHRLALLGIAWGLEQVIESGKQGRFHENWTLKWLPDFEIRLIEAGTWGNTVEDAAARRVWQRIRDTDSLPELTRLLGAALKAELPAILPDLLQKLRDVSALAKDALLLADAVLPLAEVLRYGSARRLNLESVAQLLEQIVPRVCVQLPAACTGIDENVAADIAGKILAVNRATGILQNTAYEQQWTRAILSIAGSERTAPLLCGLANRLLFDKTIRDAAETGDAMRFHLSRAQSPAAAALWIEGFLHGSGLLLLHHAELWQTLDAWVRDIPDDVFPELLPLLRRAFSRFSDPERQKMLELAKNGLHRQTSSTDAQPGDERAEEVLEFLKSIFS